MSYQKSDPKQESNVFNPTNLFTASFESARRRTQLVHSQRNHELASHLNAIGNGLQSVSSITRSHPDNVLSAVHTLDVPLLHVSYPGFVINDELALQSMGDLTALNYVESTRSKSSLTNVKVCSNILML